MPESTNLPERASFSEGEVNRWKTELIANGFRPQRHGFVVRMVRRLLWPFVRPFHFYILEEMGRISGQRHLFDERQRQLLDEARRKVETELRAMDERAAADRSALSRQTAELADRQNVILAAVERMVGSQSILRTEIATVVHRHAAIASEIEQATAELGTFLERLEQVEDRARQAACRLGAVAGQLRQLGQIDERGRQTASRLGAVADRLGQIDHRTKLFLTHTPLGLLLLKDGEYISDTVARTGTHDQHIVEVMDRVAAARPGSALDVGAHFGFITLAMAKRFARVISFEPNLFNFSMLTANVVLNRIGNVQCVNAALYSHAASLSLGRASQQEIPLPLDASGKFDGLESPNLGAFMFTEDGSGIFPTEARTIDSLELGDLQFLKIDVQGADGEVLQGGMETIRRCRPVIVFEWEALLAREFSVTLDEVRAMLADAGYMLDVLKVHNEKQTDYLAQPRSA